MSYTPSLETQLADLQESWRNLVRQRDEQGERIRGLEEAVERLQAVADAAREHEDAKARYNQAMRERDFDVAAAAQSDELYAHTALLTALAALQPPPTTE